MTLSADTAVLGVRALAGDFGLEVTPTTLADRSNLVLRLDPLPLVARVAMATSMVRVGMAWLRREVEISRWLASRGGLVTRPTTRLDPGPHLRDGMVISFWDLEELSAERLDPAEAGAALAELHRTLVAYPEGALPPWGAWEEVRLVMGRAKGSPHLDEGDRLTLDRAFEVASRIVEGARARSASFQAVHGDAHIANVLATRRGAVWTDWEDAFVGPREYDIACLRSKADLFGEEREAIDAMTAAYAARCEHDASLVTDLGFVRNVQVVAWLAVFAERHLDVVPRLRARLAKLGPR